MMDKYSKIVVTIIAVCLVLLNVQLMFGPSMVKPAQAQRIGGTVDVNIVEVAGTPMRIGPYGFGKYASGIPVLCVGGCIE